MRMTRNSADAEDLLQETFLRGFRGYERFEAVRGDARDERIVREHGDSEFAENLRLQDHPDDFAAVAGTLDQLAPINPTQPDPAPSTASSSNKPRRR